MTFLVVGSVRMLSRLKLLFFLPLPSAASTVYTFCTQNGELHAFADFADTL